jgi:hypothetical protein
MRSLNFRPSGLENLSLVNFCSYALFYKLVQGLFYLFLKISKAAATAKSTELATIVAVTIWERVVISKVFMFCPIL